MVQGLRVHTPSAGGPGLILGQGTRSHMLQLKIPPTATKTQYSQIRGEITTDLADIGGGGLDHTDLKVKTVKLPKKRRFFFTLAKKSFLKWEIKSMNYKRKHAVHHQNLM